MTNSNVGRGVWDFSVPIDHEVSAIAMSGCEKCLVYRIVCAIPIRNELVDRLGAAYDKNMD